jgi:hypothetical protein
MKRTLIARRLLAGLATALALATIANARVTKIVIESTLDPDTTLAATGPAGAIKRTASLIRPIH